MQTLTEISQWIRDYGHDPRHIQKLLSVRFDWHQLWTALDVIDDIDLAMTAYVSGNFPLDPGEQYLRVYGVFQALFTQQDALNHFIKLIRPAMSIDVADTLKEIREARNASVGHPTKLKRKGDVSAHGISRITMSKQGFQMISFSEKDGVSFHYVPVLELIEKQRAEAVRILSGVVRELEEEDEAHKAAFRHEKLSGCFNKVMYAFEKISAHLRGGAVVSLGAWGAEQLQSSLDDFENLLKARGLGLSTYDMIKYRYDEIKHPLTELRKFFVGQSSEIRSSKTAIVFTQALESYFSDLMDIAKEIDEEYSARRIAE